MADLVVDPAPFLTPGSEDPNGPLIPMVVSLTFPGMDQASHDLQDEFTQIAFESVRQAGGRPRLVDSAATDLRVSSDVFDGAAGIVFLGGADIDTDCYGYAGQIPENLYGVDRRADDYCISLLQQSALRDLPTLAICRGSQLMNVAFGGTLIPDIIDFTIHHGAPGGALFVDEPVSLDPESKIAHVLGDTQIIVRNGHHQAVGDVGDALKVTAFASDGIVEGTEHREARWMVGVQWHPEEPNANVAHRDRLFGALVTQAGLSPT